jgi:OFA family oxalate/formate antiporter-like MFS transporter
MRRWIVLLGAVLVQMVLGGVYAWSTFAKALIETYPLNHTQAQSVFSAAIATFTLVMIPAGRVLERLGPRPVAAVGGILFAAGYFVAAASGGNPWALMIGAGIVAGAGIGCGYVCPLSTCAMWFPHHRGLVTGVAVAGFGLGAVAMSSAGEAMLRSGMDVLTILGWIGGTGGAVVVLGALALARPAPSASTGEDPPADTPTRDLAESAADPAPSPPSHRIRRAVQLGAGLTAGTFAGLLVVSNLKSIGDSRGLDSAWVAPAVSIFAVGNAAGRLLAGHLVDRLGERAVLGSLLAMAGTMTLLLAFAGVGPLFLHASLLVAMAFGSCFVVYVAQVAREFGPSGVARLYPWMFLGYGGSGLLAPIFGAALFDLTGSYTPALITAAVLALAASGLFVRSARKPHRTPAD